MATQSRKGATQQRKKTRKPRQDLRDEVVNAALDLAEEVGWDRIRLREVADRLGIPLADLRAQFRDKEAIADAWLARADTALLVPRPAGYATAPVPDRLHRAIMDWLDALAPHRQVTGQMLAEKLWPFHPHHYVPMVFWLSRTVQWIREAAILDAPGRQRQVEEIGLTALFVATVAGWVRDDSAGQERTRRRLQRRLEGADRFMGRAFSSSDAEDGPSPA